MKSNIFFILFIFYATSIVAQVSDSLFIKKENGLIIEETIVVKEAYNPLAPATAAFYSAVLPGLGQAYNKKYWKIPIIYAGMGVGIYFYVQNDEEYQRFRDAYKSRLAGFKDDEFWGEGSTPIVSTERLIDAQKDATRDKNLSILITGIFYVLNIIDANVDAHLRQFNVSDDLSLEPNFNIDPINSKANYGLSFKYTIK